MYFAAVGMLLHVDHFDQGAFTDTGLTGQKRHFAFSQRKGNIPQDRLAGIVGFAQIVNFQHASNLAKIYRWVKERDGGGGR